MKNKKSWQDIVKKLLMVLLALLVLYILICSFYGTLIGPLIPSQCTFPAGFICRSYQLHPNGELDLVIGQGTGHTIRVVGVTCTQNTSSNYLDNANINNYASDPIEVPSHTTANISRSGTSHTLICTDAAGNPISDMDELKPGYVYNGKLYVNYTEIDTGKTGIAIGSIAPRIPVPCWGKGPCSCMEELLLSTQNCILFPILVISLLILELWMLKGYLSKPKKA